MSAADPTPAEPDFLSVVGPFTSDERYEFIAGLEGLWNRWEPDDERWLILQKLIWTMDVERPALRLVDPIPFDERCAEAVKATTDAIGDLIRLESIFLTKDAIETLRASAAMLARLADDLDELPIAPYDARLPDEHEPKTEAQR